VNCRKDFIKIFGFFCLWTQAPFIGTQLTGEQAIGGLDPLAEDRPRVPGIDDLFHPEDLGGEKKGSSRRLSYNGDISGKVVVLGGDSLMMHNSAICFLPGSMNHDAGHGIVFFVKAID
jgi:hypothetical protein